MSENEPDTDDNEEEPAAEPVFPSRGPNREGMVSDYLPEQHDWEAKTKIDLNDPAAISALVTFEKLYPEVDDLQPIVDEFLHHFLKSKTSVKGASREEYKEIFMAMYGKSSDGESSSKLQLVAADAED